MSLLIFGKVYELDLFNVLNIVMFTMMIAHPLYRCLRFVCRQSSRFAGYATASLARSKPAILEVVRESLPGIWLFGIFWGGMTVLLCTASDRPELWPIFNFMLGAWITWIIGFGVLMFVITFRIDAAIAAANAESKA